MGRYSVRFELDNKEDKQGLHQVLLRISREGKHARLATGVRVKDKAYNPASATSPVRKSDESELLNAKLTRHKREAEKLIEEVEREGLDLSVQVIRDRLAGKDDGIGVDFIAYAEAYIRRLRDADVRTVARYTGYVNRLRQWRSGQPLPFTALNAKTGLTLIREFESWLNAQPGRAVGSTMGGNTIAKAFQFYKSVATAAVDEELLDHARNPFRKVDSTYTPPVVEHLTAEEVERMKAALLPNPRHALARDLWLFQLYCAGRRVGDVLALRWRDLTASDGGYRWNKAAQKTNKPFSIQLPAQALEIIERYRTPDTRPADFVFPMLDAGREYGDEEGRVFKKAIESATTMLNKRLRKVGEAAGVDRPFSTHSARHSFSRMAKEAGASTDEIKDALEHSSVSVTEGYLDRFASDAADKVVARTFGRQLPR